MLGWHFFTFEFVVDFFNARMWSNDFDVQMRLALRVRTNEILNNGRSLNVHDVSSAVFATELHTITPRPRRYIGNSDVHLA